MTLRSPEAHGREQARLAALTGAAVAQMAVAPDAVHESWLAAVPRVLRVTVQAQITATTNGPLYVADALAEQNLSIDPDADVITRPLIGVAGDGRPLDTLADVPRWQALDQIAAGVNPVAAVEASLATLTTMMATAVQDAGRASESLAIAARPRAGYVRQLTGSSCSRCVVLGGKFFRWNAGFDRHPNDDCTHIPTAENIAGDVLTDPKAFFRSLSESEQDRRFGKPAAQAIRDGADIGQVVNARRGMQKAQIGGRDVLLTSEGTTRRGFAYSRLSARGTTRREGELATRITSSGPELRRVTRQVAKRPRIMPETIYEIAEDRADALRLLRANGYTLR